VLGNIQFFDLKKENRDDYCFQKEVAETYKKGGLSGRAVQLN